MASTAPVVDPLIPWDNLEPHCDGGAIYSKILKADLLPGTFILLANHCVNEQDNSGVSSFVVARIISATSPSEVTVNLFKKLSEVSGVDLLPPVLSQENHLRHMQEVGQTAEHCSVNASDIKNFFLYSQSKTHHPLHFSLMVWLEHFC